MNKSLKIKGLAKALGVAMAFVLSTSLVQKVNAQGDVEAGQKLFQGNCAACHLVGKKEEKLVGPGLLEVRKRWKGKEDLLKTWIKNPKDAYATGDSYVAKLWDYDASEMPAQAVSDEDVDHILAYLDAGAAGDAAAGAGDRAAHCEEGETDLQEGTNRWIWFLAIAGVLIVVAMTAFSVRNQLELAVAKANGQDVEDQGFLAQMKDWVNRNKVMVVLLVLFFGIGGAVDGIYALFQVGVYGGADLDEKVYAAAYHPSQPIAFRHDVHTSEEMDNIDCKYCHNSVEKSKHAGIPSANVCMNCHKAITKGTCSGEEEIAKIYEAVNFDVTTRTYGDQSPENLNPIKWNKVHNLPDHVYFNHSQHVVVGEIECETCHGKVQEMTTVYQYAPLTMGWCINCHRETSVAGFKDESNMYYRDIEERMQKAIREHKSMDKSRLRAILDDNNVTVSELGGLECAKCHY